MVTGAQPGSLEELSRQMQQLLAEMQLLREALKVKDAELAECHRLIASMREEKAGAPMQQ